MNGNERTRRAWRFACYRSVLACAALVGCSRTELALSGGPDAGERAADAAPPTPAPSDAGVGCEMLTEPCGALALEGPRRYRCDLDHPELRGVPSMVVADESSLYVVRGGDPAPLELYRSSLVEDGQTTFRGWPAVLVRGEWVAVQHHLSAVPGGERARDLAILSLADGGRPRVNESYRFSREPQGLDLVGNAGGLFVLGWQRATDDRVHHVFDGDEARTLSEPFRVAADPGSDGWVLVDDALEPSGADYDWYDLRGGARRPSCYRTRPPYDDAGYWDVARHSPGIVYVVPDPPRVVYERNLERCHVDLAGTWPLDRSPRIVGTNRQGWVLIGWDDGAFHFTAANVATGARLGARTLTPPPGLVLPVGLWTTGYRRPAIDHAGAVVTSLERTDASGSASYQMYRTSDGATWEPLGREIVLYPSSAYAHEIAEAGGTYVLGGVFLTETGGGRYSLHVVRPERAFARDLARSSAVFPPYVMSEDGRCIGMFRQEGRLAVLDTATGSEHLVQSPGGSPLVMAFVPAPER